MSNTPFVESMSTDPVERAIARNVNRVLNDTSLDRQQRETLIKRSQRDLLRHRQQKLTDFDPDGEEIAAAFARSLRDDFHIQAIYAVKVALTAEDVAKYDLPSDMDAKESSPNYQKFVDQHGSKVVELDAAPVKLLQAKLREAIESVIDVVEFNAQAELEAQDAATVEAHSWAD